MIRRGEGHRGRGSRRGDHRGSRGACSGIRTRRPGPAHPVRIGFESTTMRFWPAPRRLRHTPASAPISQRVMRLSRRLGIPELPRRTSVRSRRRPSVRRARADHRSGRIDDTDYTALMKDEIDRVVGLQEELGLDVVVHGEPERNDMVQYFAENLDGFATTDNGSRCSRMDPDAPVPRFSSAMCPARIRSPWNGRLTPPSRRRGLSRACSPVR